MGVLAVGVHDFDFAMVSRSDDVGDFRTVERPSRLGRIVGFIGQLLRIRAVDADTHQLHAAKTLGGERHAWNIFSEQFQCGDRNRPDGDDCANTEAREDSHWFLRRHYLRNSLASARITSSPMSSFSPKSTSSESNFTPCTGSSSNCGSWSARRSGLEKSSLPSASTRQATLPRPAAASSKPSVVLKTVNWPSRA